MTLMSCADPVSSTHSGSTSMTVGTTTAVNSNGQEATLSPTPGSRTVIVTIRAVSVLDGATYVSLVAETNVVAVAVPLTSTTHVAVKFAPLTVTVTFGEPTVADAGESGQVITGSNTGVSVKLNGNAFDCNVPAVLLLTVTCAVRAAFSSIGSTVNVTDVGDTYAREYL